MCVRSGERRSVPSKSSTVPPIVPQSLLGK
jgi:hypothetical protein